MCEVWQNNNNNNKKNEIEDRIRWLSTFLEVHVPIKASKLSMKICSAQEYE